MSDAQKALRSLLDRQSTERGRLGELAGLAADKITDEHRTELRTLQAGTADLESQLRAARLAVEGENESEKRSEPDSEMRERLELRSKASLGKYLLAAARGRVVDGSEHELAAAAGVDGIPLELWDVPSETRSDEKRVVADPVGTVGVNLQPIVPQVFAGSIASRLGIDMPKVGSGSFASATITTSQSAAALAKSGAAVGVAGAFTVQTATPKRVSARLELTIEDIAAVGVGNFESALRQNLSLALSSELDDQAINGNGTAPNLAGVFHRLGAVSAPAANVETWTRFLAIQSGGVDGLWASELSHIGMVVGVDTFRLAAATFQGSDSEESAASYLKRMGGGFWTNSRMPAKSSNIQDGIQYRMGMSMEPRRVRTAVCPHWGVVNIDDIYSGSAKGERYFSMHVLLGDVILTQPAAYSRVRFRVS